MEPSVAFVAGVSLLVLGLSYILRARDWERYFLHLQEKGRAPSLKLGATALVAGSFIVGFHPVWHGSYLLLTAVGVIAMVKGAVYLLFPGWLPAKLKWIAPHYTTAFHFSGVVIVILSYFILCEWWHQPHGMAAMLHSSVQIRQ